MGITLQRVAFSANIKERRDFSCAIFDADGALLAQAAHIPVHLGSMGDSVRAVLDRLGRLEEGDIAIVNDPFAGGTHLPDITLVAPVMHDGVHVGYVANRAHHADVGGKSPGSMTLSRHIDEEGFRIEPSLLYRGGTIVSELLDRFLAAVRTPDERLGDLDAQIAANRVGAAAFLRMIELHGPEHVQAAGRAAARLFAGVSCPAPDRCDSERRVSLRRCSRRRWHRLWAGRDPGDRANRRRAGHRRSDRLRQAGRRLRTIVLPPSLARPSTIASAALLEEHVPLNGGSFRNIDVVTKPGTVVDAQLPAAVVAGKLPETSQRVVDVVFSASPRHAVPGQNSGRQLRDDEQRRPR